jgi:hypothetical protein
LFPCIASKFLEKGLLSANGGFSDANQRELRNSVLQFFLSRQQQQQQQSQTAQVTTHVATTG